MKNRMRVFTVVIGACLIAGAGCTNREAATVGAMIGHRIGTVFGTAAVAVEETFETAKDVQDANPRWDHLPKSRHRGRDQSPRVSADPKQQHHYYSTNVLIKTRGPAHIVSVETGDTEDVTSFWGQ